MGFTVESLEPAVVGTQSGPTQFDLPSKEFIGYDPKGTTTITGSPIADNQQNVRQPENNVATNASAGAPEAAQEESVTLSSKVSAIARRDQAQRQKERDLARREQALADKIAAGEKYLSLQEKLKAKDYSAAEELGLSSNELAKFEVDKLAAQDPNELRARKLEEEIANLKRQQEERQIEEYKTNQVLWKEEISRTISTEGKFPELSYLKSKGQDAEQVVLQLINDSFDEDGVELSADQAAALVEKELKKRADFYAESPSIRNRTPEVKVMGPPKASTKTITQTMTTTPKTAPASKPFHLMSESEQIAEAIRRVQAAKLQR